MSRDEREQTNQSGVWLHKHSCHWWTNGHRFRLQPPQPSEPNDGWTGKSVVLYEVRALGITIDPAEVPKHQRCPTSYGWPAYRTTETAHGRLRSTLIDAFGATCPTCRTNPATDIDHDHFTGLVRGLLCQYCNSWVDRCLHLSGCPFAEYLTNPPATRLRLRYPQRRALRGGEKARIARIGINPYPTTATSQYLYTPEQLLQALSHNPRVPGY
ncbi:endonuclease domain-containing protein [Saccharopolyspora sp. NPDC002686]|uniref:endonuclease domain-containing protein n=1 Tax=Saccharopolyspora sp. NPDC002686 TaxID=3154541 RepID=UPI003321ABD1